MSWSNTAHITPADEAEHEASMNLRRLQRRIHELRDRRPQQADTAEIDKALLDTLHAMLDDGIVEEIQIIEDEDEDD